MRALHPNAIGTAVITEHALALAELGRRHPGSTPIPTCGDWTLDDLVWHLAEVHDFWSHVIGARPAGPEAYEPVERPASGDPGDLSDLLDGCCRRLVALLDAADPADAAWSWSDDHTVGFTLRRQSHEALIHHLDGVLAVEPSPRRLPDIAPELAADGIDELVGVMLTGVPEWAAFHGSGDTIRIVATDTGDRWSLEFGRMTGTSPDTGRTYDVIALEPSTAQPATTVAGRAALLLAWMWGRGSDIHLDVTGDRRGVTRLRDAVADSTQ